jgi:hypothetical protein
MQLELLLSLSFFISTLSRWVIFGCDSIFPHCVLFDQAAPHLDFPSCHFALVDCEPNTHHLALPSHVK